MTEARLRWPYHPLTAHAMRRFAERVDGVRFPASNGTDACVLLEAERAGGLCLAMLAQRMLTPLVRATLALGRGRVTVDGCKLIIEGGVVVTTLPKLGFTRAGCKLDHMNRPGKSRMSERRQRAMVDEYA